MMTVLLPNCCMELERFYCKGLGLEKNDSFEGHAGYDGIMIGLPDAGVHQEFTQHEDGSPCPSPTADNLLVFYIPNQETISRIMHRLDAMGYPCGIAREPVLGK